jgi:heme/copper-type cytochrome/quinol oxidase subunit 4
MDRQEQDTTQQRPATGRHWQYSLFGLLVVTTIVSVCLAVGVHFPRMILGILAAGLVQVVALYSVEWVMRRRGGQTMRQVTVSLWAIVIVAVVVIGLACMGTLLWIDTRDGLSG